MTKQERREYGKKYREKHNAHIKKLQARCRDHHRKRRATKIAVDLVGEFGAGLTVSAFQNAEGGRAEKYLDDILKGKRFLTMAVER